MLQKMSRLKSTWIASISCKKKYQPKSWWSVDVLSLLLALHLQLTAQYSVGEQSLDWLGGKAVETKKFEHDQKNREVELKLSIRRRKKNRKKLRISVKLSAVFDNLSAAFVSSHGNDNASIDQKLNAFKNDLFQQLDAREQAAEARIAAKLDEKFGDLVRILRGG
jgi:hypothetical protein